MEWEIGECEECGNKASVNAILNGKAAKLCKRCFLINNAIEIPKSRALEKIQIEKPSVNKVLEKLTGIKPKPYKNLNYVPLSTKSRTIESSKSPIISEQIQAHPPIEKDLKTTVIGFRSDETRKMKVRDFVDMMKEHREEEKENKSEQDSQ